MGIHMARVLALCEPLFAVKQAVGVIGVAVDLCDIEKIQHVLCLLIGCRCARHLLGMAGLGDSPKHTAVIAEDPNVSFAEHGNVIPCGDDAFAWAG
jgi:hypothetical protein